MFFVMLSLWIYSVLHSGLWIWGYWKLEIVKGVCDVMRCNGVDDFEGGGID